MNKKWTDKQIINIRSNNKSLRVSGWTNISQDLKEQTQENKSKFSHKSINWFIN
jgi:hypothetical protein